MKETLIVIPQAGRQKNNKKVHGLLAKFREKKRVFYYEKNTVLFLKKILLENKFEVINILMPSLEHDSFLVKVIKTLAPFSRVVLYHPDISFIRKTNTVISGKEEDNVVSWYRTGKSIQLNVCRIADMIVAKNSDDKKLLNDELLSTPVVDSHDKASAGISLPAHRQKKTSIVMLTFNQYKLTRQCIESLEKHTSCPYELIIVDNGSEDGTVPYLKRLAGKRDNVKLIFNKENVGFSRANNQGMRIAEGEYLLLLNNDVILTPGWLDRMILCAESDPHIGVVGPCTNKAVGQQVVHINLKCDDSLVQKYASMHLMRNAGSWIETHRIIGFCMLVKRDVIKHAGMLDERFGPGGFEDYDYCLRIRQTGYKIVIAEDVFIYHIGGQGYSNNNLDYDKLRNQNVHIFVEKWCKKALEILETIS